LQISCGTPESFTPFSLTGVLFLYRFRTTAEAFNLLLPSYVITRLKIDGNPYFFLKNVVFP
jgi:hypothetical protein